MSLALVGPERPHRVSRRRAAAQDAAGEEPCGEQQQHDHRERHGVRGSSGMRVSQCERWHR